MPILQPRSLFSMRRKAEGTSLLPLYKRPSRDCRRNISGSRLLEKEKLIHLVPVIVVLGLFILWWFSYPVSLGIKNGRITAAKEVETRIIPYFSYLANQASNFPPYPLISEMQMVGNDSIAE